MPSHYLNQCRNNVNLTLGNKLQWNLNRNQYIFIQENAFENVVWKMAAICLGLNVLNKCNNFCDKWNLKLNHDDARTWTHITTLCEGNPPVSGTFPSQGPLMQSFDIFLDVSLRKQMAKSSCQWFETPCHSCDVTEMITMKHLYNMVYHNTISYVSWCIKKCWI